MRLTRVGPPFCEPDPTFDWKELRYEGREDVEAYVQYDHFGLGSENTSRFVVPLTWQDVEAVIAVFAKMDYPRANASKHHRVAQTDPRQPA
jgi:hypothetical protein